MIEAKIAEVSRPFLTEDNVAEVPSYRCLVLLGHEF